MRPIRKKMIHQSQATLDAGNIYTSSAYEKTKKQYNERMSRLRNSNISNQINMSPQMKKKHRMRDFISKSMVMNLNCNLRSEMKEKWSIQVMDCLLDHD